MLQQGSEKASDAPEDPRDNQGLADELNAMLQQHSEGSAVIDASPEHGVQVEKLLKTRGKHETNRLTNQELRLQALQELAAKNGVVTAGQEEIEAKMQEIAAREAGESQQSAA